MESITITSISELLDELKKSTAMLWFRGQTKHSWNLEPSAFREANPTELESQRCQRFKLKAPLFSKNALLHESMRNGCH